jgi:hypothetical protein
MSANAPYKTKEQTMKFKIKYILPAIAALLISVSCEDDAKKPFEDFQKGVIPVFAPGADDTGFIDLTDFNSSKISFDLATEGDVDVQSVDVILTYNNSVTGVSTNAKYSTLTSLPATVAITFDQLMNAFPKEVVTQDSLDLGDSFNVNGFVTTTDGRYLDGGYSPSVVANKLVLLTYNVACASNLAGTYDFELISGDNGELASQAGQTIVQKAAGYYEVSDISMDIFGATPIKYRFTDICGSFTADAESVDYGDQVVVSLAGSSVDLATGVITFHVEYVNPSCCGLAGVVTEYKATPK